VVRTLWSVDANALVPVNATDAATKAIVTLATVLRLGLCPDHEWLQRHNLMRLRKASRKRTTIIAPFFVFCHREGRRRKRYHQVSWIRNPRVKVIGPSSF
jgi:hypothetical protein